MGMLMVPDFVERIDELVELLKRLVEIETPSTDKAAVDRLGTMLADELRVLGALVTIEEQTSVGNHVIGRWGRGRNGLLLLCHMDTVWPSGTLAQRPCVEKDGQLYGPGTYDMKGGIAMALTALAALRQARRWPLRPITLLLTSDEEIGSRTSRPLIEKLAREAELTLCLEPCLPDGGLKTWRKGIGEFEIVIRGRAAHAGSDHQLGRNAIEELAHHVLAIQQLTDYAAGITTNVGLISGGTRVNVVPAEARAKIDVRVPTQEAAEQITCWMKTRRPVLDGVTLEISGGFERPPMPRTSLMSETFQRAQAIGAALGLKIGEGGSGGGSDANFAAALGVPVLDGLGAPGDGAHSEDEHVDIDRLAERTALVAAILSEW